MSVIRAYIGTYTKREGHVDGKASGFYAADFDTTTGNLKLIGEPVASVNPSYLAVHPSGETVYVANEMFDDLCSPHAILSAFRVGAEGSLQEINTVSSEGIAPCFVTTDGEGKFLYGVNYKSGRVVVCPIRSDGGLEDVCQMIQHEGSGPHGDQDGPHAHSIYLDESESFAIVPDKGADRVCVYGVRSNGKLKNASCLNLPAGSGPRHFAFHPGGQWAYVINELNSTITSCLWNAGQLVAFETMTTLPSSHTDDNKTADIQITPDGKFLYGSNRGHDSLAGYHIDSTTGALIPIGHTSSGGRVPRGFAIDPSGQWLLCAGQNSDNVTVFEVDSESGSLTLVSETAVPTPVCIKFSPT
jgi:6-phosphogluconolactonase